MGNDECLPDSVVGELTNNSISSEDLNHICGYPQDIIAEFLCKGNVEKIFPMFYNCAQETDGLFHRLSREEIRNSKHWNSQINKENLKVLLAGKTENSHYVKDRGGLWKVRWYRLEG